MRLALALLVILGSTAAMAQTPPADVDATATAVEFSCRAQQPAVAGTAAPAVSLGLYNETTPASNVRCIALASGQTALVNFSLAYSASDPNPRLRARAYAAASCSGLVSPASANACRVTFLVPAPSFVP
jgi:hypothetical protein